MFPCYTSLVSPGLARHKANAVEFATNVALRWLTGNSATDVGYDEEIVQRVVTQKLTTYIACRYTYILIEAKLLCTMAATRGLINTCTQLSIGLLTCSTCTRFSSNQFVPILYLFLHPPPFLRIFSNLCPLINSYS